MIACSSLSLVSSFFRAIDLTCGWLGFSVSFLISGSQLLSRFLMFKKFKPVFWLLNSKLGTVRLSSGLKMSPTFGLVDFRCGDLRLELS